MALIKKEKVCSVETYQKGTETKKAYCRVGELLTFINDQTGQQYQRLKLGMFPGVQFSIFEEEKKEEAPGV